MAAGEGDEYGEEDGEGEGEGVDLEWEIDQGVEEDKDDAGLDGSDEESGFSAGEPGVEEADGEGGEEEHGDRNSPFGGVLKVVVVGEGVGAGAGGGIGRIDRAKGAWADAEDGEIAHDLEGGPLLVESLVQGGVDPDAGKGLEAMFQGEPAEVEGEGEGAAKEGVEAGAMPGIALPCVGGEGGVDGEDSGEGQEGTGAVGGDHGAGAHEDACGEEDSVGAGSGPFVHLGECLVANAGDPPVSQCEWPDQVEVLGTVGAVVERAKVEFGIPDFGGLEPEEVGSAGEALENGDQGEEASAEAEGPEQPAKAGGQEWEGWLNMFGQALAVAVPLAATPACQEVVDAPEQAGECGGVRKCPGCCLSIVALGEKGDVWGFQDQLGMTGVCVGGIVSAGVQE